MIQLEERLYTSTEVAEILGVSLRSVYRYLEEGKLDAEIKTATGRHRFSKKNIMDFLYPNGATTPRKIDEEEYVPTTPKKVVSDTVAPVREAVKEKAAPVMPETEMPTRTYQEAPPYREPARVVEPTPAQEEEPVDWLAKFREAAKKFREESDVVEQPVKHVEEAPRFSSFTTAPQEHAPTTKALYYRSTLGGLKEIAQNIDKTSRSAGIPYAFTMNAGLSLYKPIKPFSMLHAYVKSQDLPFFERVLSLTPAEESSAQLCLYASSDTGLFANREEMHGLFVVTKKKLLDDIIKSSDSGLADEAKSVL